jgi:hypothetical protein
LPTRIQEIGQEFEIFPITYLLFGLLLNEYPDNYSFELVSRLLPLYNIKPYLTRLLKQCDELGPHDCALIVPYHEMQAPANGLLYSLDRHTMPVQVLQFTNSQSTIISLSNKIIVINLRNGNVALDIKLPELNESYLQVRTLFDMSSGSQRDDETDDYDSLVDLEYNDSFKDDDFQRYNFLVNSIHHIYLVSSHNEIKFHRSSTKGYLIVEMMNYQHRLCLLVEHESSTIDLWNIERNQLQFQIDLSSASSIRQVLSSKFNCLTMIIVVLHDGTMLFYTINLKSYSHRATIHAGQHLHRVSIDRSQCICTFDSSIAIDLAYIDLYSLCQTSETLTDKDIVKTLVSFDPPISPKPIERIIFPDRDHNQSDNNDRSMKFFFIAVTKQASYIVHICQRSHLSYVRIPGYFDIIMAAFQQPRYIFTSQCGRLEIYRWQCIATTNETHAHRYVLSISLDISSSPILSIKPKQDAGEIDTHR